MIHLSLLFWAAILMSTLILAHEFGHLLAAIAVGVKVEVFSLGFGRRLYGFSVYGIDFRLILIETACSPRPHCPGRPPGQLSTRAHPAFAALLAWFHSPGSN